jgi:type I restriction enzyme S subunit
MNYLNSVGGKAAIPGINQKNVEDIKILDLNIPYIKQFGAIVIPMFRAILENCKESARLAALRDTLLPKLMSGELIPS